MIRDWLKDRKLSWSIDPSGELFAWGGMIGFVAVAVWGGFIR